MTEEYDEEEEPLTALELLELKQSMEELTEFIRQARIKFKET